MDGGGIISLIDTIEADVVILLGIGYLAWLKYQETRSK